MTVLTRYRIEGTIGIGRDGPVHRAVAERLGSRPVALRAASVPAGRGRDELRRRAETIARLGCPHLAIVSDIVELDADRVQLASTLGPHGNLADRLVLGPLAVEDAAAVTCAVIEALAAAHRAGIVHGHLSPANIVFGDHGPIVTDIALPPRPRVAARHDVVALAALALALVDDGDASPAVRAYRSLWTRVGADPSVPLLDVAAALARVPEAPAPVAPPRVPPVVADHGPSTRSATAVAAAVGMAATVGLTIGVAATWLPALAG